MDFNKVKIEPGWKEALKDEFSQAYFDNLTEVVRRDYVCGRVYPPASRIFAAFDASRLRILK